nr:hypothetical protein BaRGS_024112 [Batillaria attramentaria]
MTASARNDTSQPDGKATRGCRGLAAKGYTGRPCHKACVVSYYCACLFDKDSHYYHYYYCYYYYYYYCYYYYYYCYYYYYYYR